jgi:hypothetical protein
MKLSLASALPVAALLAAALLAAATLLAATLLLATATLFLAIPALFVAIALLAATALLPPTALLLAALLFKRRRLTWLIRITLCFHLLPFVIAQLANWSCSLFAVRPFLCFFEIAFENGLDLRTLLEAVVTEFSRSESQGFP